MVRSTEIVEWFYYAVHFGLVTQNKASRTSANKKCQHVLDSVLHDLLKFEIGIWSQVTLPDE